MVGELLCLPNMSKLRLFKHSAVLLLLTCSLVLKVVFDVVGLQAVHVRAPLGRAIVKVVVDHVVHDVAAQSSDKH